MPDGDDFEREIERVGEEVQREIQNCFSGGCDPAIIVRDFDLSSEAVGELGRVLYQAAALTMEERHAGSTQYYLGASQKTFLRPYFGDLVDRVTVVYNARLMDYLGSFQGHSLKGGSEAQTYGYRIYVDDSLDQNDLDQIVLLGHELVHVQQYERYSKSLSNFGYHYFKSWAANGFEYTRIAQEEEANDKEEDISGLYIQNDTPGPIWVAVGFHTEAGELASEGWWKIESGQYRQILAGSLDWYDYYVYAVGGGSQVWEGSYPFWVHPTEVFDPVLQALAPDIAASYGYALRMFREFNVGGDYTHKIHITSESSEISQPPSSSSPSATINTGDSDRLNVRYGPGTEYAIFRQVSNGSTYEVAGRDRGSSWVALKIDDGSGTYGWVWAQYVDLNSPLSALPIVYEEHEPAQVTVRYWRAVSDGDFNYAWEHLAPSFRTTEHNNSFNHFRQGYQAMNLCSVGISNTRLLNRMGNRATVSALVTYRLGSTCTGYRYSMQFNFRYSPTEPFYRIESVDVLE